MRKPETVEYLYLDFDGFFAAVEEQARPALRGHPIGVVPFSGTVSTCIIAANHTAKRVGVKTGMKIQEAQHICPDIKLVPQSPDLYERAHRKLLLLIEQEIPIDRVCSIDEVACRLDKHDIADPYALAMRIKNRIQKNIGDHITCSIGIAPNTLLAKIAGDMDKPDGFTVLDPDGLPGRLLDLPIDDLPGIGRRMKTRLIDANISTVEQLWHTQARQLRGLWGTVVGERFWYALHGYAVRDEPTQRSMFGHGRILPPEWRDFDNAFNAARLLSIKAARRLRRSQHSANIFGLWLRTYDGKWSGELRIGGANDDHAVISALVSLWANAQHDLPKNTRIKSLHVALYGLIRDGHHQFDIFSQDDTSRQKWASLSKAMDKINQHNAKTIVSIGPWLQPPGGYAGGKIAFTHVPDMEDFW